jgi:hypothetical protein
MANIYSERDQLTDSQGNLTGNGRYQQMTNAPTAIGKRGNTVIPSPTSQQQSSSSGVVQPAYPTDVVSTSGRSAPKLATNYNPDDSAKEAGLRAAFQPTKTLGYRPLSMEEQQGMQNKYRSIANQRGLSNNQRQAFLRTQASQMAQHGLTPTFDLSSNKGLSVRQAVANDLATQHINQQAVDTAQTMRENAWDYRRKRNYYRDNYEGMLWE